MALSRRPSVARCMAGAVAWGVAQPQQLPLVQLALQVLPLTPLGSDSAAAAMALVAHAQASCIRPDCLYHRAHIQVAHTDSCMVLL